jgi:tRNA dimethylallyltransferase
MSINSKKFSPNPIIAILGQTATGKTSLSIEAAKRFNCEIISCDSRQVYKGLDVGSAKITKEEMGGIPHFGIDISDPKHETYSVSDFKEYGKNVVKNIHSRGKVPLIVGGSGMYGDAILYTSSFPDVSPNKMLRKKLEALDCVELAEKLKEKDPRRYSAIDKDNKRRLVRALEIVEALGFVPEATEKKLVNPNTLIIGLTRSDSDLRARIELRAKMRIRSGELQREVSHLLGEHKIPKETLRSFGLEYKLTTDFLSGDIESEGKLIELLTSKTWQFAKRQMTYYKKDKNIIWTPAEDTKKALSIIQSFLHS